ncbi:MAG: hypothetical protein RLZ72_1183 [Actinomycetota bacterium]
MKSLLSNRPFLLSLGAVVAGLLLHLDFLALAGLVGAFSFAGIAAVKSKYGPAGNSDLAHDSENLQVSFPPEREVWVRGVHYRQAELKKIGQGKIQVKLVPELNNPKDASAVKVIALSPTGTDRHIGHLPSGTATTSALFEYGTYIARSGKVLVCSGQVGMGDDGLVCSIYPPSFPTISQFLLDFRRNDAVQRNEVISYLPSTESPTIATAEFRPMELINAKEFDQTYLDLHPPFGRTICWLILAPGQQDSIDVFLCSSSGGIGPQVGRVAKKHLQYARACVVDGPVAGLGVIECNLYGGVEITIGDPTWKSF